VVNSVATLQKRLQDEAAAVEKGNRIGIQQVEALTERREGLKLATELFESEHAAIAELLQAGQPNGLGILRMGATPAPQSITDTRHNDDGRTRATRSQHSDKAH
jgi:hypothetical protein